MSLNLPVSLEFITAIDSSIWEGKSGGNGESTLFELNFSEEVRPLQPDIPTKPLPPLGWLFELIIFADTAISTPS